MNYSSIGERIKMQRTKQQKTQEQLSKEVAISQKYLSQIEMGRAKVSLEVINDIANALDVSLDFLVQDELHNKNDILINTIKRKLSLLNQKEQIFVLDLIDKFCAFSEFRDNKIAVNQ